jgi:type I restriction enzyme M protein
MNLAVHGLTDQIAEAITYYDDTYSLAGKCDFVMANPPFNVDLVYKRIARIGTLAAEIASDEVIKPVYPRAKVNKEIKALDAERKTAADQLRRAVYFQRQVGWLQDRFPDACFCDVPGLVKLVSRAEIEAADWSLTPGRYVGVASEEVDEDFDFAGTMRQIHAELAELNREAEGLAATIQENFEGLGV